MDENARAIGDTEKAESDDGNRRPIRRYMRNRAAQSAPQAAPRRRQGQEQFNIRPAVDQVTTNDQIVFIDSTSTNGQSLTWLQPRHTSPAAISASASSCDDGPSRNWHYRLAADPVPFDVEQIRVVESLLTDPIEVQLFRYWVETISPRCDTESPEMVFQKLVPQMALNSPMLLNAILMAASQKILRIEPTFPAKPYIYHERTLQQLLAYLAEKGRVQDESALIAAIFLRYFEELHGTWTLNIGKMRY